MPRFVMSAASSGGVALERLLDGADDLAERALQRVAGFLGGQAYPLEASGDEIAPTDLGVRDVRKGDCRPDLDLRLLGALLADQHPAVVPEVADDRLVHLVAAHTE